MKYIFIYIGRFTAVIFWLCMVSFYPIAYIFYLAWNFKVLKWSEYSFKKSLDVTLNTPTESLKYLINKNRNRPYLFFTVLITVVAISFFIYAKYFNLF